MSALQEEFTRASARLILHAFDIGYGVTYGETYRTPEQAALNAQRGTGVTNSLHTDRLAIDLNLFKDGVYITDDTGHRQLGAWWKALGPRYRWGGDLAKKDYNHYSLSPDGVRA